MARFVAALAAQAGWHIPEGCNDHQLERRVIGAEPAKQHRRSDAGRRERGTGPGDFSTPVWSSGGLL